MEPANNNALTSNSDQGQFDTLNWAFTMQREQLIEQEQGELNRLYKQKGQLDADLVEVLIKNSPEQIQKFLASFDIAAKAKDAKTKKLLLKNKLLLTGVPGVGKSDLSKAIAQTLQRKFTFVESSSLANEYQNSAAKNLERVIEKAQETQEPHVVILDEIQCLIDKKKNKQRNDQDPAVRLWQIIDDCSSTNNILLIGTTNSVKHLPGPLKSRFNGAICEILLPNKNYRQVILTHYLQDYADLDLIASIAHKTDGFSARDIKNLSIEIISSTIDDGREQSNIKDFQAACKIIQRTPITYVWKKNAWKMVKEYGLPMVGLGITIATFVIQQKHNNRQMALQESNFEAQLQLQKEANTTASRTQWSNVVVNSLGTAIELGIKWYLD